MVGGDAFRGEVEGAEREASARRYYRQAFGHSYDAEAASSVSAQLPAREEINGDIPHLPSKRQKGNVPISVRPKVSGGKRRPPAIARDLCPSLLPDNLKRIADP
jgi:hypothetical protein